ncbi:MAG: hypothetical protein ACYS80_18325 [Planctomycetota bacterium]|jgi:hypothetical protein
MGKYVLTIVSFVLTFHYQAFAETKDSGMKTHEEKALVCSLKTDPVFREQTSIIRQIMTCSSSDYGRA